MKKITLLLIIPLILLTGSAFSQPGNNKTWPINISGWVFDSATSTPIANYPVYLQRHNPNSSPAFDTTHTDDNGHFHLDSVYWLNGFPLNIEVYTYDCFDNRISFFILQYHPNITHAFYICKPDSMSCEAAFGYFSDPMNSLIMQFIDQSQGDISHWNWDFGDGSTSSLQYPVHTFAAAGTYHVTLAVTDNHSNPPCKDTITQVLYVEATIYHNLAGQVFMDSFPTQHGLVNLYLDAGGYYYAADSCILNNNGVYYFFQVPEGNYLLKAKPTGLPPNPPKKIWPTYYGNSTSWVDAGVFSLGQDYFQADIHLKKTNFIFNGPGKIAGNLLKGQGGINQPLANGQVILADQAGTDLDFTFSGPNGHYEFNNLPFGTYVLKIEIPGVDPHPLTVILDPGNPVIDPLDLIANNIAIGLEGEAAKPLAGPVYPNPANERAFLDITLPFGQQATLTLCDMMGRLVQQRELELASGRNLITIPVHELCNGLYLLSLALPDYSLIRKKLQVHH